MGERDEYAENAAGERTILMRLGDLERRVLALEETLAMLAQLKMYVDSDDRK